MYVCIHLYRCICKVYYISVYMCVCTYVYILMEKYAKAGVYI